MRSLINMSTRAGETTVALIAALALCGLTSAPAPAAGCSNEQLRAEDNSTNLPDCRSYEMVSLPEKGGSAVDVVKSVQSTPSGDAVAYGSTGAFAGTQGNPIATYYVASRTGAGWTTQGIELPQLNQDEFLRQPTQAFSEDLTTTFQDSRIALAPGAVEGNENAYLKDNATGERHFIATSTQAGAFWSGYYETVLGGSSDFSHVAFLYYGALTPEAPSSVFQIYDFTGGQLHPIGYLPDGSLDPAGVSAVWGNEASSVYDNGTKVFFTGGTTGGLYMRENDTTTLPVSVSQRAGASSTPEPAGFGGASADGSVVYFTSRANLTEASETHGQPTLYRLDFNTGLLSDLTVSSAPSDAEFGGNVSQVVHVSEDGSYVYFSAYGALAPGASTQQSFDVTNLYVWHQGQGVKFIAQAGVGTAGQVSPNGLHYAFVSSIPATSFTCSECSLLYDYDAESGQVRCVSCNPDGDPSTGGVEIGGLPYGIGISHHYPRAVLNDGRVFFDTTDRLVAADTNGQFDVYEWQDGALSLISSGHASEASHFAEASADGTNVFFRTGQQLVGQDSDHSVDLYDARIDGGFPAPPSAAACSGTGCQGVPSAPPIFATPPSVTFNGVGNFIAPVTKSKAKPKAKSLAKAERLTKALKACRADRSRKGKRRRAGCEATARKKYGPAHKAKQSVKQNLSRRAGR
jgi:hypothetical protein